MLLTRNALQKDTNGLKVLKWGKYIYHATKNQKKNPEALLSEKVDIREKNITQHKGHFVIIKDSIYPEDSHTTHLCIY